MRESSEVKKEVDAERVEGGRMPIPLTEADTERDAIYESLTSKPEPQPESKERPKETEAEPKEYVTEEKPQEEEKTVPYGALAEERAKRKELAKKVKELEAAFRQAAEDNKKLMELMSAKSDEEPITDYEKELVSVRKQLKLAIAEIEAFKKAQAKTAQEVEQEKLAALVRKTHDELAKDGFDGFNDFVPQVIKAMDDEDIPLEERNPAVWKRVYREIVYPKHIGKYRPAPKAVKEAAKKEASLIKSPGTGSASKKEEEWTPKTYAEWRQKHSFV